MLCSCFTGSWCWWWFYTAPSFRSCIWCLHGNCLIYPFPLPEKVVKGKKWIIFFFCSFLYIPYVFECISNVPFSSWSRSIGLDHHFFLMLLCIFYPIHLHCYLWSWIHKSKMFSLEHLYCMKLICNFVGRKISSSLLLFLYHLSL